MTIATTTSTVTIQGNGVTTVFNYPFVPDASNDLVVTYVNSSGIATVLSPSVYTVTINAIPVGGLWGIGGTVTYPNTGSPPVPIAVGTYLSITRQVPYQQAVSISNQGAFYPTVVEQALDILELQIQQLQRDLSYTLKFPVTDPVVPNTLPSFILRENGTLQFDNTGQPIISFPASGGGGGGAITGTTVRRVSTTGTATVNIVTSDAYAGVSIYQSSSPITTVQLPTTLGPYPIFDGSLNANAFPITILPPAGKTILGLASYTLAFAGQSATFWNDGTMILVS